jgi:branched-chain amino acid transport system ATP-binding protein
MSILLEIKSLTVRYEQALALERVDLIVPEKGLTAMIGPNGAGKTTLLRVISRLKNPSVGSIIFKGMSLLQYEPNQLAKMGIAHCPEGRRPFKEMTVLENLLTGGYILARSKIRDQLNLVLELFPILNLRKKQIAGTLSGGEQQMLALGRALMIDPKLLLLDEPSLGLAPMVVDELETHIGRIKESGVSVLMAEQNVDLIRLADTVNILEHGNSIFSGSVTEIMQNINLAKTYLGM